VFIATACLGGVKEAPMCTVAASQVMVGALAHGHLAVAAVLAGVPLKDGFRLRVVRGT
jgi:hypothetical protein